LDIYSESDYKLILRKRVKELAQTKKGLTLQRIAGQIPIQNTYLSKALRDEKTHLNEDHLFKICKILEFFPQEIDYVSLLRARAITDDSSRRSYLEGKLSRLRQGSQRSAEIPEFDTRQLTQEMAYLFDPLCILVQVAMFIDEYRENPRKLCSVMGIPTSKLKQTLTTLENMNFIRLGEDGFRVLEVRQSQVHYGADHPLMRTHQSLLRSRALAYLAQVPEEQKHCFMGTFSADEATFDKIKTRFRAFLKEVEPLISRAPSKNVYQMNFDLFTWF
jgi:uncharacterized protein (TIGR02147 family)